MSKHHNKLNNKADFGVGGKKEALARRAERKPSWGSQFLTASLRKYCFFFCETERDGERRTDRQTDGEIFTVSMGLKAKGESP